MQMLPCLHTVYKKKGTNAIQHTVLTAINKMQQLFTLGLTLLAVVPALCWPANDDLFLQEIQEPQQNEYLPEGYNDLLDFVDTQGKLSRYALFTTV